MGEALVSFKYPGRTEAVESLSRHMQSHLCHLYNERPQLAVWRPIPSLSLPVLWSSYGPQISFLFWALQPLDPLGLGNPCSWLNY